MPNAVPSTHTMLSLGSNGSAIGSLSAGSAERVADVEHAEAGQRVPARALDVARARAARPGRRGRAVSSGRAARTHAIAAETIGALKLVPSSA